MLVRRRPALALVFVPIGFLLLQAVAGSQWTMFPDSYRYARAAERHLGAGREQAHRSALAAFCASRADRDAEVDRLQPVPNGRDLKALRQRQCLDRYRDEPDITSADPRYQSIFSSRPGYPWLAAPFIDVFGVLRGMRVLGVLTAAAAALMVGGLLRSAGSSLAGAVAGQLLFVATPLGWWSMQALGEGLFTLATLGAVWGGLLLMRRRQLPGALLLVGSLAVGAVTRYSSALLLAVGLAAAGAGAMLFAPSLRHRGTAVLAGLSAAAALTVAAAIRALGLPSAEVTLQDTFTKHFQRPDVPDPWSRLVHLAGRFWQHWAAEQAARPLFLLLTVVATWALVRYDRRLGWLALAAAGTGIACISAHPLVGEADRLGVLMWLPVVLGIPLLVDQWPSIRPGAVRSSSAAPDDERTLR